ncbi:cytochrome P450 78A4 [Selaginella moellendorffii]|uniref:cytochrome P450 78A4 n=1 Tax=Selaginella moellendorffii TaxID=88036 RepID=UPI000D1C97CE|nr:cytochrome P450 78A4 [Selaginella moellendorffii]|eukprot:XP_002977657.2 cytochrome P450 78A4 [Selaginella moellendorffii]
MESSSGFNWWILTLPFFPRHLATDHAWRSVFSAAALLILAAISAILAPWLVRGGNAWGKALRKKQSIPGPRGWPVLGVLTEMGGQAHRKLAALAERYHAKELMAFSLGNTRMIITSKPEVARELLNSSEFADRPLKQSAQQLLFGRAIGFAPYGDYWRNLRRIASNYLFSPRQIAAHEPSRQAETTRMIEAMSTFAAENDGLVRVRDFLQRASLNNIMQTVFGRRFEDGSEDAAQLSEMVREGFELLGAFNWADHLPVLKAVDPQNILQRCAVLVPRVTSFVQRIIDEHRQSVDKKVGEADFVDVLLSLDGEDKLIDADMIAVLWEMIFRGTDTVALAELVLHPEIQSKLRHEITSMVGGKSKLAEPHLHKMVYLQAVVKETLRMHPPGPLLSWARLAIHDVSLAGHHVPAGTTAMVNMWSITHDPSIWSEPEKFNPERFLEQDIDVKGTDLRLAPFGAGRRVCPGRALGLATVLLWTARLVQQFEFQADPTHPVDLTEVLKLSSEMVAPLVVKVRSRSRSLVCDSAAKSHPRSSSRAISGRGMPRNFSRQATGDLRAGEAAWNQRRRVDPASGRTQC